MTLSHFCNYLPFEEDLALYLKNFEFPSSKDVLYQVSLKLACWFWRIFQTLTLLLSRVEINFFYHRLNLACGLKFHRLK
jgi:hypothetical protein